jgi:hypothetical protein
LDRSLGFGVFKMINPGKWPIPVAGEFKAWVCGRSLVVIVGSNPAWSMSVCRECCVVSSRGFYIRLITLPEGYYRVWCV